MAVKKPGLGRGLDALLGGAKSKMDTTAGGVTTDGELRTLALEVIQRGKYQPRRDMHTESLEDLADSIRAQGVVQPIVVRAIAPGKYEIIAGERRWRAAQMAGLHTIPSVIRQVTDQATIAMSLIENIQREELNPVEEATALQRLIDEFALTHQQAAEAVGRSRAAVSNLLRLLSLAVEVRSLLEEGALEMGHARALLALEGVAQVQAARQVCQRGLSVRETEQWVRRMQQPSASKPALREDPDVHRLQEELAGKLGAKVQFQHGAKGKGRMVIHYNTLDELDGILAHIK